jgi:hypothetical protein
MKHELHGHAPDFVRIEHKNAPITHREITIHTNLHIILPKLNKTSRLDELN